MFTDQLGYKELGRKLTHLKSLQGPGSSFQTCFEILQTLPTENKFWEKNSGAKPSKQCPTLFQDVVTDGDLAQGRAV